jgi:hypothetical protein
MQNVKLRPDSSFYAGFREFSCCWRLGGDLNSMPKVLWNVCRSPLNAQVSTTGALIPTLSATIPHYCRITSFFARTFRGISDAYSK